MIDCREDRYYNYNRLDKDSKVYIDGYDDALEDICTLFDNNLNCLVWNTDTIYNLEKLLELHSEEITENLERWHESYRNERIKTMIDSYNEGE